MALLLDQLDLASELDAAKPTGMAWTWAHPEAFHRILATWDESTSGPAKGHPFAQYDLYHDLVFRHRGGGRVALRSLSPQGGWEELSYHELHRRATSLAAAWIRRGAAPGSRAVMIQPMGPDYVLGLCAALRVGLTVTCLPVLGPAALAARVAAAEPGFVITDRKSAFAAPQDLQQLRVEELPPVAGDDAAGSHTYREAEVAFLLYSPLRERATTPIPLTAGEAYRRALCDALVLHRLSPGDRLAAPLCDPLQHQPATLMAALIRGATFVHAPEEAVKADPRRLWERPLASLGVSEALRDACLQARVARPQIRAWYRDPSQFSEWREWRSFVDALDLKAAPVTNAIVEAATGGALLTSARRPGGIGQLVLPAAGRPWILGDLLSEEQAALPSFGILRPAGPAFKGLSPIVLVRYGEELFFGDRARPSRGGKIWPVSEVVAEVEALPGVEGASAHVLFAGEAAGRYTRALVVFTGINRVDPERLAEDVRRRLHSGYGPDWVPDHITVAPALPRRVGGGPVDGAWCEGQLVTGLLQRKSRLRTFQLLTALKAALRPGSEPRRAS